MYNPYNSFVLDWFPSRDAEFQLRYIKKYYRTGNQHITVSYLNFPILQFVCRCIPNPKVI